MGEQTGLLMVKTGMSHVFSESGEQIPVTLLTLGDCAVVGHKTAKRDGYDALQLGIGQVTASRLSRPLRGFFEKIAGRPLRRKIVEFRVSEDSFLDVGTELKSDRFKVGDMVDVTAVSKGKGFQGGMKRWNFSGLRASHGVSVSHRSHGSTGQRSLPGRVFKNKKMAGHMGDRRVTTQNLSVVLVDAEKGWLGLRGCVPGGSGGYVRVQPAVKRAEKGEA